MTFQTPTTKAELVEVLKQIDDYYRYREDFYEEPTIIPLDLKKIEFTPKTEDEISSTAFDLFSKKRSYEISQKQAELNAEIIELQAQKKSVAGGLAQAILDVDAIYDQSLQKLETEFAERNMSYSSAYYNAVNELEEKRNEQKAKLTTQVEEKQEVIDGKISAKEYLLTTISDTVSYKYEALIMEYVQEQQDKQRDYADSVLKYNNQIDEKIIKNDNAINQNYSKLKLDYMSIVNKGLTTEQLNSLGYYGDVIKAIDEYYYSISAQDAYNDFCLDGKMPYYLGEYYDEILYKYKLRADM